jgi:hypothetical protein
MDYGQIYEVFNMLGFSEGFIATTANRSRDKEAFIKKVEKKIDYAVSEIKYVVGYPVGPFGYPITHAMDEEQLSYFHGKILAFI